MNRIAVISDVHSNLHALTAVLERIDELDLDRIVCLGDIVGYGARPVECLTHVRDRDALCVQGNHDALIADASLQLDFNVYSLAAVEHNRALLSEEHLAWLRALPTALRDGTDALFVHGSPDDRDRYLVFLDDIQAVATELLTEEGPGLCFFGHTHHPVIFDGSSFVRSPARAVVVDAQQRLLVNPGSVGQPRDGDPRAAFLWWEREAGVLHFERVAYDMQGARRDILDAGLPPILGDRLLQGR